MGLRARLTLTLMAIVIPVVTGFSMYRITTERHEAMSRRAERAAVRIQERPELVCSNRRIPRRLARRMGGRPHTYEADWTPLHQRAPAIPERARRAFARRGDEQIVHVSLWGEPEMAGVTLAALDGAGACAILALPWRTRGAPLRRFIGGGLLQGGVLALVLLLTGLIISIPLVRRVRRLQRAVEEAPESSWQIESALTEGADELAQLGRAFERTGQRVASTIEELERRDTALKEYISNTTHDLAIPLTVLQHRLRKIQARVERAESIDAEVVQGALEESHYIASLVANMSAAAKLEAGEAHRVDGEVRLDEVVERVVGRHRPIARHDAIAIDWSAPPEGIWVRGDATLLEQAISNLVQNAVQYNQPGGHVAVIVEEIPTQRFSLRVLDDGEGVDPELLPRLTERAVRGDQARNRNEGGQGFGLSIAQRVCDVHGFALTISNAEEGGLRVEIRGPYIDGAQERAGVE